MIQQHHRATLADAEARTHELLAAQRQEHEAGLARHLAFIDRYGRAGKGSGQGWVSAAWGRANVTTPSSLRRCLLKPAIQPGALLRGF